MVIKGNALVNKLPKEKNKKTSHMTGFNYKK